MANPVVVAFRRLPRPQQLALGYGLPSAIAAIFLWLVWTDLGEIGTYHAEQGQGLSAADVRLPAMLSRHQDGSRGSEAATLVSQIAAKKTTIAKRPGLEKEKKDLEADRKFYEDKLPTELEKAEMRRRIEDLARGALVLESVKIIEPTEGPKRPGAAQTRGGPSTKDITFIVEVRGSLNGLIKYIDAIEANERFMSVRSITVKPGTVTAVRGSDRTTYADHQVRIEILTHIYSSAASQSGGR
ncbi:MAG: hypothetical protein RLZZ127_530 [Planctomycetota bacterium]|jgi:hypothetical protein